MNYFGQYSEESYAAGLQGIAPKLPIDIATLEKKAVASSPRIVYFQQTAG